MTGIKKSAVSLSLIVLLLVAGFAASSWLISTRPLPPRRDVNPLPPLVEVQDLVPSDVQQVFVGYGSARSDRQATLAAEVAAEIVEIPEEVNDGTPVVEGQLLLRLDDREYVQQLARAESAMTELDAQIDQLDVEESNAHELIAIARLEVEVNAEEVARLSGLYEDGRASKTEYNFGRRAHDRSRREFQAIENGLALIAPKRAYLMASKESRKADAELARLYVERCRITAPFDGQIDNVLVEIGNRVMPGTPLMRLVCLKRIEVPVELPVSVRPLVDVGAPCELGIDSNTNLRWTGTVGRLSPVADVRSRTFSAYVLVDNRKQESPLYPGYFLTARVHGPTLHDVFAIPRGIIDNDEIFVAVQEKADVRKIHVDSVIDEIAIVSGGIATGDSVIVSNLDVLYQDAPVRTQDTPDVSVPSAVLADSSPGTGSETPQ